MALATGSLKKYPGTTINYITSGGALAIGAFSTIGPTNAFTNTDGYLWVDVTLSVTKSAAGSGNLVVNLYRRNLDVMGATDAVVPSANRKSDYVGRLIVDNTASAQADRIENISVGGNSCEFYIENLTGVSLTTWVLDVIPFTLGPV